VPSERIALPPALLGNQRARTHGIYAAKLSPLEDAQVKQLAGKSSPTNSGASNTRTRISTRTVSYAGKDRGRLAPTFAAALDLQKALLTGLRELGMTNRRRGIGHDSASKRKKKRAPFRGPAGKGGEGGRGWVVGSLPQKNRGRRACTEHAIQVRRLGSQFE